MRAVWAIMIFCIALLSCRLFAAEEVKEANDFSMHRSSNSRQELLAEKYKLAYDYFHGIQESDSKEFSDLGLIFGNILDEALIKMNLIMQSFDGNDSSGLQAYYYAQNITKICVDVYVDMIKNGIHNDETLLNNLFTSQYKNQRFKDAFYQFYIYKALLRKTINNAIEETFPLAFELHVSVMNSFKENQFKLEKEYMVVPRFFGSLIESDLQRIRVKNSSGSLEFIEILGYPY